MNSGILFIADAEEQVERMRNELYSQFTTSIDYAVSILYFHFNLHKFIMYAFMIHSYSILVRLVFESCASHILVAILRIHWMERNEIRFIHIWWYWGNWIARVELMSVIIYLQIVCTIEYAAAMNACYLVQLKLAGLSLSYLSSFIILLSYKRLDAIIDWLEISARKFMEVRLSSMVEWRGCGCSYSKLIDSLRVFEYYQYYYILHISSHVYMNKYTSTIYISRISLTCKDVLIP